MAMSFASMADTPGMEYAGSSDFTRSLLGVQRQQEELRNNLATKVLPAKSDLEIARLYGGLKSSVGAAPDSPQSGPDWGGFAQALAPALGGILSGIGGRSGNVSNDLKVGFESTPLRNWFS
jgi:hypothetical protein